VQGLRMGGSSQIATMALVAICIAGGLLVYSVFMNITLYARGQVSVEAVDLVKAADGTTFSIVVKNTGNKPAVSLTVKLADEAAQILQVAGADVSDANPLQPGQSAYIVVEYATPTSLSATLTAL